MSSLEGNLFSHSRNPLLNMCLLYELMLGIKRKFFSLSTQCKNIMDKCMDMAILYIQAVDDENFLTSVMLEKDYSGRDSLRIAVELELLDLIQNTKVQAIIKRIYNSDYSQTGSMFQMGTNFNIIFGSKINN